MRTELVNNSWQCTMYDSPFEVIERASTPVPNGWHDAGSKQIEEGRFDFIGRNFTSLAEAQRAAFTLWPEGMRELDRMREEINAADLPTPITRRRKLRFDENDGDEIDIDRLRNGEAFWRQCRRKQVAGPTTRSLIIQLGGNGCVESYDFLWRGAAVIALAEAMETAGYSVEIWASITNERRFTWTNDFSGILLKGAGDVLDPSTLVNVCSGWFYRTIYWHAVGLIGKCDPGMGRCVGPQAWQLDRLSRDDERVVVAEVFDREAAIKEVRKVLTPLCRKGE